MRIAVAADLATTGHGWLMERAVHYAERLSTAVDTVYVHSVDDGPDTLDGYRTRLASLLDQVSPARRGAVRLEAGNPADKLVELTRDYAMLVVGPREPAALERMFMGPMSVRVLRKAHCPVLVPRADPLPDGNIAMLVGIDVDGSHPKQVIDLAASWASSLGGTLDALYATSESLPPIRSREVRERAEKEWEAARAPKRAELAALLERVPAPVRGRARLRSGEPEDALVTLSEDYQVVLVGNRERQGIAGWVLGTVAHRVVRNAHCDVLTLPTADFSDDEISDS